MKCEMMKPNIYAKGHELLQRNEDISNSQMTSLRRSLSLLPEADRRHLSCCLLIFYEISMVTQGHLAVAFDQLTAALTNPSISQRIKLRMEHCYTNLSDALEEIQSLSDSTGILSGALTEPC